MARALLGLMLAGAAAPAAWAGAVAAAPTAASGPAAAQASDPAPSPPGAPVAAGPASSGPEAAAAPGAGPARPAAPALPSDAAAAVGPGPAASPPPAAPVAPVSHRVDEPRAYGHLAGDVVVRTVHLQLPPGLRLRGDSLPLPGGRGQALELRAVEHRGRHDDARQTLVLHYQVFAAPLQPRVLELPPLTLAFEPAGGGRVQTLRVDAWPVQVAPIGPLEAAQRTGLGPLQPDRAAPPLDTRATRMRLAGWLAGALVLAAGLAWVLVLRPAWQRRQRPLARLRRELAAMPAAALEREPQAVFGRVHAALREQAGRNLLARDLPAYLAARPGLAPLADELLAFHEASAALFFQPGTAAAPGWDLGRLRRLAEALAEAERLAPASLHPAPGAA